jgi:4-hydroxybenzoate polyprenyltransferase
MNKGQALFRAVRPGQWIKNSLVLGGALFSGLASEGRPLTYALLGVVAFTFAAGAVYLGNDIRDREADRTHPTRRYRPIAAGILTVPMATTAAVVLALLALGLSRYIGRLFFVIVGFYFVTNVIYSLGAKRIVIVDVILVSLGFVLRAVAGAVAVKVAPSSWIIVCTLELSMLVVFGKRRVDLRLSQQAGGSAKMPDEWYSLPFLDLLMASAAGASIVTYALYTLDPQTVAHIGNRRLVLTVPMVVYGCLRYLFLITTGRSDADATTVLTKDWGLRLCAVAWVVMAVLAVYL